MARHKATSPLVEALLEQDESRIKRALVGANPNDADSTGWTPLMLAAATNSPPVVKLLVDAGAEVNLGDRENFTPLMSAAGAGHTEIAAFLIQRGAVVDAADEYGHTALSWAVTKGDFDQTAKLLIEHGADVNRADGGGFTPLMRSALTDHPRCYALLLENGADVTPINPTWRKTAVEMALERGSDALKQVVRNTGR